MSRVDKLAKVLYNRDSTEEVHSQSKTTRVTPKYNIEQVGGYDKTIYQKVKG